MACTWFGEISSCSCLTVLSGPALVLLNKICKEYISSLYKEHILQNATFVFKSTGGLVQRDVSPCTLIVTNRAESNLQNM